MLLRLPVPLAVGRLVAPPNILGTTVALERRGVVVDSGRAREYNKVLRVTNVEVSMATVTISQRPGLNAEAAMKAFSGHFAGKYQVYKTGFLGRDFVVKKSGWTGVGVKLKQKNEGTEFVFTAMMPNVILNLLFGSIVAMLILRPSWKALEAEVRGFIENADDFR